MKRGAAFFGFAVCAALAACKTERDPDPLVERAAFGVFFGGQIQDRKELPFELDPAKQQQGFRVDFRQPLAAATPVHWEVARPVSAKNPKLEAGTAVTEIGDANVRAGETRLDAPVLFRQGQVLGVWHVRLSVAARVVLDRDVLVFDARERRERERDAGR